MKIEKVNENQIRCTLTKEDLEDRDIKLSELAYGSEKAKSLFRDMVQRANYEVGFDAEDIPLMVEAIPLSSETIILQITKVEYPEELDTRFSKFSEVSEEEYDDELSAKQDDIPKQGADDILDFFEAIRRQREKLNAMDKQQEDKTPTDKAKESQEDADKQERKTPKIIQDLTKMFEFKSLDQVCRLASVISGYYQGRNDLYKDEKKNRYYLLVHKSNHTPGEFNRICNRISEYAIQKSYSPAKGAYLAEHGKLIIGKKALEVLASL